MTITDPAASATITIASIPAAPIAICEGEIVTYTASISSGVSGPHYQWYQDGVAVGTDSDTYTTSSLNNGDSVYVTLRSGACNSYVQSIPSAPVTVNSPPVVTGPLQICVGNTGNLVPSTGGTWTSNTAFATVTSSGVITAVSAGTATFIFEDLNSCLSEEVEVQVNALPVISNPSSPICVGETQTLSPTSGGTWASNDPSATITNAGVITGVSVGSAIFTFTDATTLCSAITTSVTVTGLPIIDSVVAAPSPICAGETSTLVVNTPGGSGGSSTDVTLVNYNFNLFRFNSSRLASYEEESLKT